MTRWYKEKEILYVGNIIVTGVKDKGRLQMSKINFARRRLLEILVGYPAFLIPDLDTLFFKAFLL